MRTRKTEARFHEVLNGDCLEMLKTLDANSVHSVVSDPPAGISFMGKGWDDDKGGRDQWIKWLADVMTEVRRVLKPGGHALIWALPRTSHWTARAVEDAGFEIRDVVTHLFGCGYPKGQDISKLIDKRAGMARQVVGHKKGTQVIAANGAKCHGKVRPGVGSKAEKVMLEITGAATAEAKKWEGWSTALKPAAEFWILARKPLAFDTLAENVKRTGAGALNIDGCRVPIVGEKPPEFKFSETAPHGTGNSFHMGKTTIDKVRGMTWTAHEKGRWPANLLLTHSPECKRAGTQTIKGSPPSERDKPVGGFKPGGGPGGKDSKVTECIGYADENGDETVEVWDCAPGCPVRVLDDQAGQVASRYFNRFDAEPPFAYVPKATIAERNVGTEKLAKKRAEANGDGDGVSEGADAKGNIHPTVKSLALMTHLITLITPPGGIVLDPFAGSGTTLVAAKRCGRSAIGIEREYEYWKICKARLENGGAYV